MTGHARISEFSDDLFECINSAIAVGDEITTLSRKQPNWIASIDRTGIWVETEASRFKDKGAKFVPAWMFDTAWNHLRQNKTLRQDELLRGLKVHRSAFVCALLARFPGVVVHYEPSTTLALS